MQAKPEWQKLEETMHEMVESQRRALLLLGRRIVPSLTSEDVLQPNDYPELEHHPEFRYEEGVLAGMQTVQMALRVLGREKL